MSFELGAGFWGEPYIPTPDKFASTPIDAG